MLGGMNLRTLIHIVYYRYLGTYEGSRNALISHVFCDTNTSFSGGKNTKGQVSTVAASCLLHVAEGHVLDPQKQRGFRLCLQWDWDFSASVLSSQILLLQVPEKKEQSA